MRDQKVVLDDEDACAGHERVYNPISVKAGECRVWRPNTMPTSSAAWCLPLPIRTRRACYHVRRMLDPFPLLAGRLHEAFLVPLLYRLDMMQWEDIGYGWAALRALRRGAGGADAGDLLANGAFRPA